jgi:hypothetical protein
VKDILIQVGGVVALRKVLAAAGMGYTRPAIYLWLKNGHLPRHAAGVVRTIVEEHLATVHKAGAAKEAARRSTNKLAGERLKEAIDANANIPVGRPHPAPLPPPEPSTDEEDDPTPATDTAPDELTTPTALPAGWGMGSL